MTENSTHYDTFSVPTELDTKKYYTVFDKNDKDGKGYLNYYELKFALDDMGIEFAHPYIYYKMVSDLQATTDGKIHFFLFCKLANQNSKEEEVQEDFLDAFVAMGGNEDETGCVDADKLIGIIKNDLQMTINIEQMIKDVDEDGSGEIEYDEFKALLETEGGHPEIKDFNDWFCFT